MKTPLQHINIEMYALLNIEISKFTNLAENLEDVIIRLNLQIQDIMHSFSSIYDAPSRGLPLHNTLLSLLITFLNVINES